MAEHETDPDQQTSAAPAKPATTAQPDKIQPPKTRAQPPSVAKAMLERKKKRDARAEAERRAKQEKDSTFFLRCPNYFEHVAAWLTEHPRGAPIHPGMWFSFAPPEHKVDEPYVYDTIFCQQCFAENGGMVPLIHLRPQRMQNGSVQFTLTAAEEFLIGWTDRDNADVQANEIAERTGAEEEAIQTALKKAKAK